MSNLVIFPCDRNHIAYEHGIYKTIKPYYAANFENRQWENSDGAIDKSFEIFMKQLENYKLLSDKEKEIYPMCRCGLPLINKIALLN